MAVDAAIAQDIPPVNSGANPYRVIRDWAQLTQEKRPWGGSNGVAVDRDGKSVWATDRCSPGTAPGCLGTKANPVHLFDDQGKEVRSFGGGCSCAARHPCRSRRQRLGHRRAGAEPIAAEVPHEDNKGSVVASSAPTGVLMTLGKPGVRGNRRRH
jgi:hypothetical protein